eukprot:TRINITY_DN6541_c0_g1_i3.p1 TRINITY_DN6541_c0_g1~~TRINITY_DN6541_c0_g1_i3.p1  ORF type:complete len:474 (-),score=71.05 TRINITY_DN6541_c0_g1_i3:917-2200(-)
MGGGKGGKGGSKSWWGPNKGYVARSWDHGWQQQPYGGGFHHGGGYSNNNYNNNLADPLAAAAANVETALCSAQQVHNVARLGGVLTQIHGAGMPGVGIPGNTTGMSASLLNAISGGNSGHGSGSNGDAAQLAPQAPASSSSSHGPFSSETFNKMLAENASFSAMVSKVETVETRIASMERVVVQQQTDLKEIRTSQAAISGGINELLTAARTGAAPLPVVHRTINTCPGPANAGHRLRAPGPGAATSGRGDGMGGARLGVDGQGVAGTGPVLPVVVGAAVAAGGADGGAEGLLHRDVQTGAAPPAGGLDIPPAGHLGAALPAAALPSGEDGEVMIDARAHEAFCKRWDISTARRDIQFEEFLVEGAGLVPAGTYWPRMMRCKTLDSWKAKAVGTLVDEMSPEIEKATNVKGVFDIITAHGWPELEAA